MEIEIIEPGFYYHIYNRGINHEVLFPEDIYYMRFLNLYESYMPKVTETLAYCLLPTHFHFLLYIKDHPDGISSNQFSHLFNAYAQWFNGKKHRNGGLFQRPFKRKRVSDELYLRQLIYYIHRNPMHHKIVGDPAEYQYSSYETILYGESRPRRGTPSGSGIQIHREFVLELFETLDNFVDYHYHRFEIDKDLLFEEN